jgi:hypothetical protein
MTVPIGFIYTQLPKQPEPNTLWPSSKWEDVSKLYAGLFFRVLGENSSDFGVQEESDRSLTEVSNMFATVRDLTYKVGVPKNGTVSDILYSGDYTSSNNYMTRTMLKFRTSNDEIRPKNQAIRIWKRIE